MSIYQNMNQFAQTQIKGTIAAIVNPVTISAQIDPGSSNTLYAGSAVKLVGGSSNQIMVDKCAAADQLFGFIIYNPKKDVFTAGNVVEVALPNSVIVLEAYQAITRGNNVEFYPTGDRVKVHVGVNPICGQALDNASGTGSLLRVLVKTVAEYSSSSSSSSCSSSSSSSSKSA